MNEWMNDYECGKAWMVIGMKKYVRISRFAHLKRLKRSKRPILSSFFITITSHASPRSFSFFYSFIHSFKTFIHKFLIERGALIGHNLALSSLTHSLNLFPGFGSRVWRVSSSGRLFRHRQWGVSAEAFHHQHSAEHREAPHLILERWSWENKDDIFATFARVSFHYFSEFGSREMRLDWDVLSRKLNISMLQDFISWLITQRWDLLFHHTHIFLECIHQLSSSLFFLLLGPWPSQDARWFGRHRWHTSLLLSRNVRR